MTKNHAEIRFEKARKKLSESLQNLEDIIKNKLHETAIQSKMIDVSAHDIENNQAMIVEQANTIQNLSHEINNLQENLLQVGKETEFLNEKNRVFAERLESFRKYQAQAVEAIEVDLARIEEIINNEE
jgi:hypothetical protein